MIAIETNQAVAKAEAQQKNVYEQFKEEYGVEETPDHKKRHRTFKGNRVHDTGCNGCREALESNQLRQKYGLLPVQLTNEELYSTRGEERA